jgi:hypothetical protein
MHFSPPCFTYSVDLIFLVLSPEEYLVRSKNHKAPHHAIFTSTFYVLPFRQKLIQRRILEDRQRIYSPQYQRQSFTPTENCRHNYSSVYCNLSFDQTQRLKLRLEMWQILLEYRTVLLHTICMKTNKSGLIGLSQRFRWGLRTLGMLHNVRR